MVDAIIIGLFDADAGRFGLFLSLSLVAIGAVGLLVCWAFGQRHISIDDEPAI